MRILVELERKQIEQLDEFAKREKTSRAAVIRKAIREFNEKSVLDGLDAAYGLWGDREQDGLEYQERIRSEW